MKLYTSLKSLILEASNMDVIIKSIKDKQIVVINYDGDEPGGKGLRTIEPVCLGYSKAGNPVLRAWDYEGASHKAYKGKKPLPSWRFFRLDRIISFIPTRDNFETSKPGYNPRGDKSMTRVIINAKFD
jgi:predicted DNA-binding transcriptional regulator YafY